MVRLALHLLNNHYALIRCHKTVLEALNDLAMELRRDSQFYKVGELVLVQAYHHDPTDPLKKLAAIWHCPTK